MEDPHGSRPVLFGDFVLDPAGFVLTRRTRRVPIERLPMELLLLLASRNGQVVARSEIVERLWGRDVYVDVDTGINTVVRKLRRALRESAADQRFVQTVPRKGYRFSASLRPTLLRLAVLPFENLSGNAEYDFLAAGLTEETIAAVGLLDPERLAVVGRTSAFAYQGTTKQLATIGRELGVDYLVESSLRPVGERLRITSRLVVADQQRQLWATAYDATLDELVSLQIQMSRAIAEQVHLRFAPERAAAVVGRQTHNAAAYELYLRGRHCLNQRTPAAVGQAISFYEQAIAVDGQYALAWAGIADAATSSLWNSDTRPAALAASARRAAGKALREAPTLVEAQAASAFVRWVFDWDWPGSIAAFRRAIALDPNDSTPHWMLAHVLSQEGQQREAGRLASRARELDPLSPMTHAMSSQIAFQGADYAAARRHATRAIDLAPQFWIAHMQLGQVQERESQYRLALESLAEASQLSRGNAKPLSLCGYIYAKTGETLKATDILQQLDERSQQQYVPASALALVHLGLGSVDRVFHYLERALVDRDIHLVFLPADAKWQEVREDARFRPFLERCGLRDRLGESPKAVPGKRP